MTEIPKVFSNLSPTPQFAKGVNMLHVMRAMLTKPASVNPKDLIPSVKTDLKNYFSAEPVIFWFGHSSFLIHADGFNILVDPVLSGHASPFRFQLRAFKGADEYKSFHMPDPDLMLLTHNHYDHFDFKTQRTLAPRTKKYIMPLRVSDHLKSFHIAKEKITELNWWESADVNEVIKITATPARHFSGRGLLRNRSLWCSYVLEIKGRKIFIGGDSGYDTHFADIGKKYGPFDLALLECGQYNAMWPYIHSMPEELMKEGEELRARVTMPVHWGKFALSTHPWKEPVERFVAAAEKHGTKYIIPRVGEPVLIGAEHPVTKWWKEME
jgi:L-ascorbate metabolism protein UlaG (beta-lactamase superfamily)